MQLNGFIRHFTTMSIHTEQKLKSVLHNAFLGELKQIRFWLKSGVMVDCYNPANLSR